NASGDLANTEIYEPENARFVPGGTMPIGRSRGAGARLQDGRVLIAGGSTPEGTSAKAAMYRPAKNEFTAIGSLQNARTGHTATTLGDGTVLIAAGEDGTPLASAELYTPDFISQVTLQPAASTVMSASNPNVIVNLAAAGNSGTVDTVTVTLTDAAGGSTSASTTITVGAGGTGSG